METNPIPVAIETNIIPVAMEADAEPEDVASVSEDDRYDVIICHSDSETELAKVLADVVRGIRLDGRTYSPRVEILGNILHLGSQSFEALTVIDDIPVVMFFRTREFFRERLNGFAVGAAIQDRLQSRDKDKHWTVCPIDVRSKTNINCLINSLNGVTLGSQGELKESAKENIKKLLMKKLPRVRSCPGPCRGLQDEIAAGQCRQTDCLQSIAQGVGRGTDDTSPPDPAGNESSETSSQTSNHNNSWPNFQTDSPPVNGEGGTPAISRERQLTVATSGSQRSGPVVTASQRLSQIEAGEDSRVVAPVTRSGCETPSLDSIALYAMSSSTYCSLPSHLPQSVIPDNSVPYHADCDKDRQPQPLQYRQQQRQAPPYQQYLPLTNNTCLLPTIPASYQQYLPENARPFCKPGAFVRDNAQEFPCQSPQQQDPQQQLYSNLAFDHVPSASAFNRGTNTQQQQQQQQRQQHQACQHHPQTYNHEPGQPGDNQEGAPPPNGARPKERSGPQNSNMLHVADARRGASQQSANCIPNLSVTGHDTHRCSEASHSFFTDPQPGSDDELLTAMENLRTQSLTPPVPDKVDRGSMEGQDLSSTNSHSVDLTVDGSVCVRNSMTGSLETVPNCPTTGIQNSSSRNSS